MKILKDQLRLIGFSFLLLVLQFGIFNYLPVLRLINLGLIAVLAFSYFGGGTLKFLPALLILGCFFDCWGVTPRWGFYSLVFVVLFFGGAWLKKIFLRGKNLFSYLTFFLFLYLVFITARQIQNQLVFQQGFQFGSLQDYLFGFGINLPAALIVYYGNFNTFFKKRIN